MNNSPAFGGSAANPPTVVTVVGSSAADSAPAVFDLCVIGAGPAGYRAAEYAARQGLRVAIVEQDAVGGTCLNRGCIPTKTYVHSTTLAEGYERQQQVVAQLRYGVESILAAPGITLLRGHASFVDSHTVRIESVSSPSPSYNPSYGSSPAGSCPSSDFSSAGSCPSSGSPLSVRSDFVAAKNIIIATGSRTKLLPLPDIDDQRLVTSTQLLQLQTVPRRLCIIGAGVVGMEFASIFRRYGSEVTVVEYLKECLPMLDSDIAKRLRKLMEKRGIVFRMKTAVNRLSDIDADVILMATGRRANTDGLNLAAAGIATAPDGSIPVDDNFRVVPALDAAPAPDAAPALAAVVPAAASAPAAVVPAAVSTAGSAAGLYAIGDVNGRQMLAHAAEMQALHVVNHILGRTDGIRFDIMPAAIFTDPEAACVGTAEGPCHKAFWRANGKALAMGEPEGMLKLFYDAATDRITGCHAYGAHAADIIQEVSTLMCRDTTVAQLRDMVHIHPTLGEILHAATE